MSPRTLPLLQSADPERPVFWAHGRAIPAREFIHQVAAVAHALPEGRCVINLCEHRDSFIVAFCAVLMRGQTNLLPSARTEGVVAEIVASNSGSNRCDDEFVRSALAEADSDAPRTDDLCRLQVPAEHVCVRAYTSGSTGTPQAHTKLWRSFAGSSALNAARMRECLKPTYGSARPWIVATVPPQHMYGLETSVILPLVSDVAVHAGRPLFPADIVAALEEVPEPRVLVTTPVHMRAIAASGLRFPRTALVVSATAPLDAALASSIESQLETTVLEMFGSTETCVIATRRTSREEAWHLYPEVALKPDANGAGVNAPWFAAPMRLQDIIECRPDNRFTVIGRNADMIEVAGKRASLADLTRRLLAVQGVKDAVVFQPDAATSGGVRRVAALVVAPDVTTERIYDELAKTVDPAFIPRPLLRVQALPRNDLGKIPREKLVAAMRGEKSGSD